MNIWAIVPVKPLNRSKSRLAPVLNIEQREALSREMFEKTLVTLKAVKGIGGILVVSRDTAALAIARQFGAHTVQESGQPELNAALARATNAVMAFNARGALILASDMPLMAVEDIEGILEKAKQPPVMVIATDRRQDGTNALLVSPAGLITYSYGAGSYHRHIEEGWRVGLTIHIYESERLALDIDTPADLERYRARLRDNGGGHPEWLPKVEAGSGA